MPRYYPIQLNLEDQTCLVVGGGAVAARKVGGLLEAGARVRVVSLRLTPELQAKAEAGEIEARIASYAPEHLDGVVLAFAATDDRRVNAQVAADAGARGIPVNVADSPEESRFLVPSVVRRGELCLSVSTGGHSPMLAARLCDELEARFGPEYADFVELLGQMRSYIKERTEDVSRRRAALARLVAAEAELLAALRAGPPEAARARAAALIEEALKPSLCPSPEEGVKAAASTLTPGPSPFKGEGRTRAHS
ncbi:MAG TPA: bifunctional precorrin-2 dehydrogenase/sirohydrochlorin ferrochelatase [Chthonomonadaceae bacterium]|nr:bifunctional precorrin-2 dehydrogenase/sirohydrochlorin ferrochelatase [Chthonomonadaceae bacterium]